MLFIRIHLLSANQVNKPFPTKLASTIENDEAQITRKAKMTKVFIAKRFSILLAGAIANIMGKKNDSI